MRVPSYITSRVSVLAVLISTLSACGGGGGGGSEATSTSAPKGSLAIAEVDKDHDGLIEISTLEQLDWIRNDLKGASLIDNDKQANSKGCPSSGCFGYELVADLNFDTNGDGVMDSKDTHFDYEKDGSNAGWRPIPQLSATIEGNDHRILNLYINRPTSDYIGLFSGVVSTASQQIVLRNIEISGPLTSVTGRNAVGALAGQLTVGGTVILENIIQVGQVSGVAWTGGIAGSINLLGGSLTVNNNNVSPTIVAQYGVAGGLAGLISQQQSGGELFITNNFARPTISAEGAGGLIGTLDSGNANVVVDKNSSAGSAIGTRFNSGGLFGSISNAAGGSLTMRDSISSATVSSALGTAAGGLIGGIDGAGTILIEIGSAAGDVSGTAGSVGGLIGGATCSGTTVIRNIHARGKVTGASLVDGGVSYVSVAGGAIGSLIAHQNGSCIVTGTYSESEIAAYAPGGLIGQILADEFSSITVRDNFSSSPMTSVGDAGGIVSYVNLKGSSTLLVSQSMALGRMSLSGSGTMFPPNLPGGLVGRLIIETAAATYSFSYNHWATDTTTAANSAGAVPSGYAPVGLVSTTRVQLECPVAANDTGCVPPNELYHGWNQSTDTHGNAIWDFGTTAQLPGLRMGDKIHRPVFDGTKYTISQESL